MSYKKVILIIPISIVLVASWTATRVSATVPGVNEHADQTTGGVDGNLNAGGGTMSHDGRYVAFSSRATNLVASDTNNTWDIFVRDRTGNTVTRASVSSSGTQANSYSQDTPSISDDGRYVAFSSNASNLVASDTNSSIDVFVYDMQTGTTQLVSSSSGGAQGDSISQEPVISGDGKFVAFSSYSSNLVSPTASHSNIYVKNLATGNIQMLSKSSGGTYGNGDSWTPSISCDGGVVAFQSNASNLVASDTNTKTDAFVDVRAGGDTLTDITIGGNQGGAGPRVSCDGMHVAYTSDSTNLVAGDTNAKQDIFKYDRRSLTTSLASVDSSGSQGNDGSSGPSISGDGRLIAFASTATNLVASDTNAVSDTFLRDTVTGVTYRLSVDNSGTQGNASSTAPVNAGFSNDNKYVYFNSSATNLISGDTANAGGGFLAQTGL